MNTAPLKALILAGGKSLRMGQDKSTLIYHQAPQVEFLHRELSQAGIDACVSCRPDQIEAFGKYKVIEDQFDNLGPVGAILSAFASDHSSAWLVIACDMPLINQNSINYLVSRRNPSKTATAFYNKETSRPDPLFTIWEPASYPILESNRKLDRISPVKILMENDIELIKDYEEDWLKNINTPEERDSFLKGGF